MDHFAFFKADQQVANQLLHQVNWSRAFSEYDLTPFLGTLASESVTKKKSIYQGLSYKLSLIFGTSEFKKPRHAQLRNEMLFELCSIEKYLTSEDSAVLSESLLNAGADPNYSQMDKRRNVTSCLARAVWSHASEQLIDALFRFGASIDGVNPKIIFNARDGKVLDELARHGITWDKVPLEGLAWGIATMEYPAMVRLVRQIQQARQWKNFLQGSGLAILCDCATLGHHLHIKYLLAQGASVDTYKTGGTTPLMIAVTFQGKEGTGCVQALLASGASVHTLDSNDKSPLMWAVEESPNTQIVKMLLSMSPRLDATDINGNTALHYCAARTENEHLNREIAGLLLDAGADIDSKNRFGQTPSMLLAKYSPRTLIYLAGRGADLKERDLQGLQVRDYANKATVSALSAYLRREAKKEATEIHPPQLLSIRRSNSRKASDALIEKLRLELIRHLDSCRPSDPDQKEDSKTWHDLRLSLRLASEGIEVSFETIATDEVCRHANMLSGPFFLSREYPFISNAYPVVQVDLRLLSALGRGLFGDGLLQVWETQPKKKSEMWELITRVIPRNEVRDSNLVPFPLHKLVSQDRTALNPFWDSDPVEGYVKVFDGLKSCGIQGEDLSDTVEYELRNSSVKPSASFLRNYHKYCDLIEDNLQEPSLQLFGSFATVQYSSLEVGKPVLLTFPYGASGNAQVFFDFSDKSLGLFTKFTTR